MTPKIKAIITGATGMVGEGVLHEALQHSAVESILVINRKPCGVAHPKLTEIIHGDFSALSVKVQSAVTSYFHPVKDFRSEERTTKKATCKNLFVSG